MGGEQAELVQPKYGPSVILMAGLQVRQPRPGAALHRHCCLCSSRRRRCCSCTSSLLPQPSRLNQQCHPLAA